MGIPSSEASPGPQPPTAANLARLEAASAAGEVAPALKGLQLGGTRMLAYSPRDSVLLAGQKQQQQYCTGGDGAA